MVYWVLNLDKFPEITDIYSLVLFCFETYGELLDLVSRISPSSYYVLALSVTQ